MILYIRLAITLAIIALYCFVLRFIWKTEEVEKIDFDKSLQINEEVDAEVEMQEALGEWDMYYYDDYYGSGFTDSDWEQESTTPETPPKQPYGNKLKTESATQKEIKATQRKTVHSKKDELGEFIANHTYKNVLFVTGATYEYKDLLKMLMDSLDKLNVQPQLTFMAESSGLEKFAPTRAIPTMKFNNTKKRVAYGQDGFKKLVCHRPEHLLKLLEYGIDVLYIDVDIYFFKDPMPYFKNILDQYPDTDILVQSDDADYIEKWMKSGPLNSTGNYCSCIQYLRPTKNTKTFIKALITESIRTKCSGIEQEIFGKYLKQMVASDNINMRILPPQHFPNGHDLFDPYYRKNNATPVMAHGNWALDKYKKKLKLQKAIKVYGTKKEEIAGIQEI